MKITTSTHPLPNRGGFALCAQHQIDELLTQATGLIQAEYKGEGRVKTATFHFFTEREGYTSFVTLKNEDFGTVYMLIEV